MNYLDSSAALPDHLRADPRLLDAARRRDIGALFAIAHQAGISYNRISSACDIPAERVSKLAKGDGTVTSLPVIERICDGLWIPGHLLGLAARPWEQPSTPVTEQHDGDDPMKRRELLRGALAASAAVPGVTALTAARRQLDAAFADDDHADLNYLEGQAERYSYGYHGQDPKAVLDELIGDCSQVRLLLDRPQSVTARTRLAHVAGQLAGELAIVLHDTGQHRDAQGFFTTAARAARESSDRHLHAWVLGRHAMVPLNYGAPGAAVALTEQARREAGDRSTAAAALAAAVQARAQAARGNRDAALAAAAEAEQLMDELTPQQAADTWVGYPRQKHLVHMSQAFTLLGDTRRAYEVQDEALALSRSPSLMTRALLAIDHATCLVHDGEPEEAARSAAQAYGQLPASYRTGLTRTRAIALYQALPPDTRGRELLHEALALAAA